MGDKKERKSALGKILKKLEKFQNSVKLHPDFLFRGQTDEAWSLEPSLTRILNQKGIGIEKGLQLERETINRFAISAQKLLPFQDWMKLVTNDGFVYMGWLVIMQHFSAPTRKLDWTVSPLVGLYFACNNHFDKDGRLWIADFNKVSSNTRAFGAMNQNDLFFSNNDHDTVVFTSANTTNERIESQQGKFSVSSDLLADHKKMLEGMGALKV